MPSPKPSGSTGSRCAGANSCASTSSGHIRHRHGVRLGIVRRVARELVEEADYAGLRRQQEAAVRRAIPRDRRGDHFGRPPTRSRSSRSGGRPSRSGSRRAGRSRSVGSRDDPHLGPLARPRTRDLDRPVAVDGLGVDLASDARAFRRHHRVALRHGLVLPAARRCCAAARRAPRCGRCAGPAWHASPLPLLEAPETSSSRRRRASVRGTPAASVSVRDIAQTAYLTPQLLPPGEGAAAVGHVDLRRRPRHGTFQ